MVAGGPYGLEELIAQAGFSRTLVILLITPLVWSLPTALMVGELASALPLEGGYYVWVRRALGRFWGFQEAWLSLSASIFDMAIYPTLFVSYSARLWPAAGSPVGKQLLGTALIAACAALNIRGVRVAGGAALVMAVALLAPFAALIPFALVHSVPPSAAPASAPLVAGILIAMWNYMGWDNASTIAAEVDRPQRTYPLAMLAAVAVVALSYLIPVAAVARTGINPAGWTTGAWVNVGRLFGGRPLELAIVVGGMVCGSGMFNALVMSYSRLPLALAQDGYLPSFLARRHPGTGAPWVAILACAACYTVCLPLGFERLVELDVLLYGLSLMLEFVALVVLRIREPALERRFRVPGGLAGAALLGLVPGVLLVTALVQGRAERAAGMPTLLLGWVLVAAGPLVYLVARWRRNRPDDP